MVTATVSSLSRVVGPLPNGLTGLQIGGDPNYLLITYLDDPPSSPSLVRNRGRNIPLLRGLTKGKKGSMNGGLLIGLPKSCWSNWSSIFYKKSPK